MVLAASEAFHVSPCQVNPLRPLPEAQVEVNALVKVVWDHNS